MTYIKAPYNFVPLNRQVVTPHWADRISHDIPFANQESGSFTIRIKAHSPLFVQDGLGKETDQKAGQFSNFLGKYFLPGSSIKGMVRNVLEVMSFAKLGNKVNNHRYAIRDLSPAAKTIYMDNFKAKDIYAGWLSKKGEQYFLEDCGAPGRISHRKLDEHYGTDFGMFFQKGNGFDQRKNEQKAAQFKYKKFAGQSRVNRFSQYGESAGRLLYEVASKGEDAGTIVFTGQPGPRMLARNNRWTGHHLEFIFFNTQHTVAVREEVIQNFEFAYHEHDKNRWSIDYAHWRSELRAGNKIPVFFRKDAEGTVQDFGLSFLYKMPYRNSVREAIAHFQTEKGSDLAEAIFGFINTETQEALKGRVYIGHAFAKQETAKVDIERGEVLSGPKASYYPNYIRQAVDANGQVRGRHQTFMDKKPEIAGWKRYPIHRNGVRSNPKPPGTSDKVLTKFVPLKEGAIFEGKIRYHNLKKEELGALLSALTFHNTANTFHSIGMAKPLGYGKISIEITGLSGELDNYLSTYEAYMNAALGNQLPEWHVTPQITELMTMVSEQNNQSSSELSYMKLGVKQRDNHFVEAKKAREALDVYSKLNGIQARQGASYTSPEEITAAKARIIREKAAFQAKESPKKILELFKAQQKEVYVQAFENQKTRLIAAIQARQQAIAQQERQQKAIQEKAAQLARKEERMAAAQSSRPDFENIDPSNKKAFDELKKVIARYVENYHGKKYDQLQKDFPEGGILPSSFHEKTIELVQSIIQKANKNDRKKWSMPLAKNANMKKVREWIGVVAVEKLMN